VEAESSRWWVSASSTSGCSRPTSTVLVSCPGWRSCSRGVSPAAVSQWLAAATASPAPASESCPGSRYGRTRTPTAGREFLAAATRSDNKQLKMNEWMKEWIKEGRKEERKEGRIEGRKEERKEGRNERTKGQMKKQTNESINWSIDQSIYPLINNQSINQSIYLSIYLSV